MEVLGWMCGCPVLHGHLLNILIYPPQLLRFCVSESWVGTQESIFGECPRLLAMLSKLGMTGL